MQTTLKKEVIDIGYAPRKRDTLCYELHDLENEEELSGWIKEAESKIGACPCCGNKYPKITHEFSPGNSPCLVGVVHPHKLYAVCYGTDCCMRTRGWHAEDTEEDFKEALRLIVKCWNRRPDQEN